MRVRTMMVLCGLLVAGLFGQARADDLWVAGYNVESGGADIAKIRARVGAIDAVSIWGFAEVDPAWVEGLVEGATLTESGTFAAILGTTGSDDRLAIVYDTNRLEYVAHQELGWINMLNRVRAPLVGEFKDKATGQRFLFAVNHLYRSKADQRLEQARLLNEWAAKQTLPLIAVGDYNFDFEVEAGDAGKRDPGYDQMTANGAWTWVRPATLVGTTCPSRYTPAVLDFVFADAKASGWAKRATILRDEADCADKEGMPDHFPVLALFDLPKAELAADSSPETGVTKEKLLERLVRLEEEVKELRRQIEKLGS